MNIKSFLKLVEIQTKVASIVPFIVGLLFTLYRYEKLNMLNMLLFLISLLGIDMATTALNNYMDFKKAVVKEGYNYEHHNAIVAHGLTEKQVKLTINTLLIIGMIAGFFLVFRTDLIVLLIGILSFGVGILYSFGPIPISRTPLGEIFSGFFMGGLIFFVTVYVQVYDLGLVIIQYTEERLILTFSIMEFLAIFIVSIPMIAGIANIMLANNLCDLEEDVKNKRHTLPYYIGRENGLKVFASLYYFSYAALVGGAILNVLPITCLLVFITFPLLRKGIVRFKKEQRKDSTFVVAVENFIIFSFAYGVTLGLGILAQHLF